MPVWASLLLIAAAPLLAAQVPPPTGYVDDQAGVIDRATEAKLVGYIRQLKQKTGAELAVVTRETLGGRSIEEYTGELAESWGVGKRGQDTGVVILVAIRDRKWRIEVGYGNEGVLPDARAGQIGEDHIVPHFRAGRYSEGLYEASLAAMHAIAWEYGVLLEGIPTSSGRVGSRRGGSPRSIVAGIGSCVMILFVVLFLVAAFGGGGGRRRGGVWPWLFLFMMTSGHRRGGWGHGGFGGGFGGGGFGGGGFGGFGGGSFGGGGASGSW